MSHIDLVAIPANSDYVTFDQLRLGRSTQHVVGRLLRFWDAKNMKKDGEFMGIVLLILDEKNTVIHGFIPSSRAHQHRPQLREGAIYNIGSFEVGNCTNLYKITDHPFLLRFLESTSIIEVDGVAPTIKTEKFMLRDVHHLQALASTNLELPDVVGQIRFVQGSSLNDPTNTQRLVIRLCLDTSVVVYLSLWDAAAGKFRELLCSQDTVNPVMVVTSVNPKLFGGNLYLNSTPATRFYFGPHIEAIQLFTQRMGMECEIPFQITETKDGIRKKETVSLGELHAFVSSSNEQTQDADFLCKAQVIDVHKRNGWSYVSCAGCSRKLTRSGSGLTCNKCASPNVTGVARYRVELAVHDGSDGATFVVFDSEMVKLTNKTAAAVILDNDVGTDETELPQCLQSLIHKHFTFQIHVTPYNFTPSHRTFTVSRITHATTDDDVATGGSSGKKGIDLQAVQLSTSNGKQHPPNASSSSSSPATEQNIGAEDNTRKRKRE